MSIPADKKHLIRSWYDTVCVSIEKYATNRKTKHLKKATKPAKVFDYMIQNDLFDCLPEDHHNNIKRILIS